MDKENYNFAYHVLFNGLKNELPGLQTRDYIFDWALSQFNKKPVKIFQVGAIETFKTAWRMGSGWSDIIFGQYIKEYGGKITIADINLDHLCLSVAASHCFKYDIDVIYGDAINFIHKEIYDIYYLDGSNDPQETLDQFNKIKDNKCIVLIDDFSIKGTLLNNTDYEFSVHSVANGVGVFDLRNQQ